jgi:hypothetical protein
MEDMSMRTLLLGIIGIVVFGLIIAMFAASVYLNNNPGAYGYTIHVEGLSGYEPGLITDIIVPLPMRDGQQVFNDEDLQYKSFGQWKSVLVMTPYGKMLAFESVGRNLTDIQAEFFRGYPPEMRIENITSESLSPVLPFAPSDYTQWVYGKDHAFSTIVFIPDSIRPLTPGRGDITFELQLDAFEGMLHSIRGKSYQVLVKEVIPPGVRNWTSVVAQVGDL